MKKSEFISIKQTEKHHQNQQVRVLSFRIKIEMKKIDRERESVCEKNYEGLEIFLAKIYII